MSVIVPVADGERLLGACLDGLLASDLPRAVWELIVVDDGSLDGTVTVAGTAADVVIRLPGPPQGPAYARNRGVEASLGDIVVFVDPTIRVHAEALRRILWCFARDAALGAVFGSYDADPPDSNVGSQFHYLREHLEHRRGAGAAESFWAGLGAVRREAFARAGRFDEWYFPRPQIEDAELGFRLRALEYRILLDPDIAGTPLKRWGLRSLLAAEMGDRVVPWVRLRLALGRARRRGTLRFRPGEWVSTWAVCGAVLLVLLALRLGMPALIDIAGLAIVTVLVLNLTLYRFLVARRGPWFAVRVIPLHMLGYLCTGVAAVWAWILFHVIGSPAPPPDIQAYAERGFKTWPPLPAKAEGTSWVGGRELRP
jgi:glycosyltransferase involved in cell wall biosynthesis